MDLSALVVVIVLTGLFLGAVIWMQIHSRRISLAELPSNAKRSKGKEKQNAFQEIH